MHFGQTSSDLVLSLLRHSLLLCKHGGSPLPLHQAFSRLASKTLVYTSNPREQSQTLKVVSCEHPLSRLEVKGEMTLHESISLECWSGPYSAVLSQELFSKSFLHISFPNYSYIHLIFFPLEISSRAITPVLGHQL